MASPDLIDKLSANAQAAERSGEWMAAAGFYAAWRQAAPGQRSAWLGEARALRESGRLDEWEALMASACAVFPDSFHIHADHAAAVFRSGDETAAIAKWRDVAERFPGEPAAHTGYVTALNRFRRFEEAARAWLVAAARFPAHLPLLLEHARTAEGQRDWAEAHRRWRRLADQHPDRMEGPLGMALALREQRAFDAADTELEKAMARFGQVRQLLEAHALVAQVRRDRPACIARWRRFAEHCADHGGAHQGYVAALREANLLEEAEAALAAALGRLPGKLGLLAEKARIAAARGQWEQAIAAWEDAHAQAQEAPEPVVELAGILIRQNRLDEAEALLRGALPRFPHRVELALGLAKISNRRRDWPAACDQWAKLAVLFPRHPDVLTGFAEALAALKQDEALLDVLDRLLDLQPHHSVGAILYARLDMRRNRAAQAVARLRAAAERSPGDPHIAATLADARLQAERQAASAQLEPVSVASVPQTAAGATQAHLFGQFLSLGGGHALALLQRQCGLEPQGLLGWASISPGGLIRLLSGRLQGIGQAGCTRLVPDGDHYALIDTRFEMRSPTSVRVGTANTPDLLARLCEQQIERAGKMKESLARGDRILVYTAVEPMGEGEIRLLQNAVRLFADNILLVVRAADADHPSGSLEVGQGGVLLGYVDGISQTEIPVEGWTDLCREASETWALLRQHRQMLSACNAWN